MADSYFASLLHRLTTKLEMSTFVLLSRLQEGLLKLWAWALEIMLKHIDDVATLVAGARHALITKRNSDGTAKQLAKI